MDSRQLGNISPIKLRNSSFRSLLLRPSFCEYITSRFNPMNAILKQFTLSKKEEKLESGEGLNFIWVRGPQDNQVVKGSRFSQSINNQAEVKNTLAEYHSTIIYERRLGAGGHFIAAEYSCCAPLASLLPVCIYLR